MIPIINLPAKIVRLFDENTSPGEVASGICMGMFMGFIPLNGPMALVLFISFFFFKINRLAAMLVLPVFKLMYIMGLSAFTDFLGGLVLIDASGLSYFWRFFTHLPVIALLDINNTLVAGGFLLSSILVFPVYFVSRRGIVILKEKFFSRIKNFRIVKWIKKLPVINRILSVIGRLRRGE
ncbi:MAG: DUF2062 domain-containing protein [Candidatus Omnitrophota bacterium]